MNRLKGWFSRFMAGRYGTDKLNIAILVVGMVMSLLTLFISGPVLPICTLLSYALLGWALFRTLSRNTYKRYRENRRYLMMIERFKDRDHRYFDCPRCKQQVRVPRKKGKISITCPKCKEKFIRKT